MIFDYIKNLNKYIKLNNRINTVINFVESKEYYHLEDNKRFEIDGENLFGLKLKYKTKSFEDGILEAHRKYLDFHILLNGKEIVIHELLKSHDIVKDYDENDDYELFLSKNPNKINFNSGMFLLFSPNDLHMPGIINGQLEDIDKLVFKIRNEEK